MKKLFEYLLVIGLLSPLLFINIRNSHDWGDDFAGYLRQAKDISEGKPFYQSGFEYHDYSPSYAPPYYSYGFPLLLSPVVRIWGLDFKALDRYMSLWMLAWGLLCFAYLRRYLPLFPALAFILIFFWNPYFFDFKASVISDIPFAVFFLSTLLLYLSRRGKPVYYHVLSGLLLAFTIGIRGIGFVLLPVIGLDLIFTLIRSRDDMRQEIKTTSVILLSALGFVLLLGNLLFKTPQNLTLHFISLFRSDHYWDMVVHNFDIYTMEFANIFYHNTEKYSFSIHYTQSFLLVLLVIGFVNSLLTRRFELLLFLVFGFVTLLFPFSTQGFRYMLPLLPLIIYYIATGARSVQTAPGLSRTLLSVVFVLFILLQYRKDFHEMRIHQHEVLWPGPQTEINAQGLAHIKSKVPDNAVIACLKPRAVELFTDRKTCLLPTEGSPQEINQKLESAHPKYLLSIQDMGPKVDELAVYRGDSLIWQNSTTKLYLCIRH